ncbi:MAG: methylenetetrahydrofolate reductase C-terminal domain-containing protein [Candidatus Syntrophoarchaeum sp.]|nr:methylenetetrahydrofolate reductase C-terminal domain-containing protein [Methanomicrobia archaeon]MBL7117581.1 methylenetetrahydrofolate reductase C-terminal domain-containing protein [Candidatus Syntrophoarchaeum sp.]
MIVVEQKPLEDIIDMVKDSDRMLVLGCDGCSGIYQVGGEKQAEVLSSMLRMGKKTKGENKEGDLKIEASTVLRQCDKEIVREALEGSIEGYDAVLSMACGAGVQTVAEVFSEKLVLPAVNTKFIGMQDREMGDLHERCSACGDCILDKTGGVCPITRCAKGLLNGPCGGQVEGKCEVGGYENDCAWILIYNKLKELEKLDQFLQFRLMRDNRISQSPRDLKGGVKYSGGGE